MDKELICDRGDKCYHKNAPILMKRIKKMKYGVKKQEVEKFYKKWEEIEKEWKG